MNTEERRQKILETLLHSKVPLTGAMLSHKFQVSRQIIVGDITVLRATGHDIYTARLHSAGQAAKHQSAGNYLLPSC